MTVDIKAYGEIDSNAIRQMEALVEYGNVHSAALMADAHLGYSQPIGGVVAYHDQISVSGVGYDIACGNKAILTDLTYGDIHNNRSALADEIFRKVEFGVGRVNSSAPDHELFDLPAWDVLEDVAGKKIATSLKDKARNQLGTVGSGNHYVDVFVEENYGWNITRSAPRYQYDSRIWIGVHFGSRGLGHNIATGFLKLGSGLTWDQKVAKGESYDKEEPTLLDVNSDLGIAYLDLMGLAGDYAYAGRDDVVDTVRQILGATEVSSVHNHHNFAWLEEHDNELLWVVRKGATPLWPGQESFIGGSMCDVSVIARGTFMSSQQAPDSLHSTVHGAGRKMGRAVAKGKPCQRCNKRGEACVPGEIVPSSETQPCDGSGWTRKPLVTQRDMDRAVGKAQIDLRGAGVDESPYVYKDIDQVLNAHAESTRVVHRLVPLIVCMAGPNVRDPFKD